MPYWDYDEDELLDDWGVDPPRLGIGMETPHDLPMTDEEKRRLSEILEQLPGDKQERIAQIVKKRTPHELGQTDGGEIKVDLNLLDSRSSDDIETLWELHRFWTDYMKNLPKEISPREARLPRQPSVSVAPEPSAGTPSEKMTGTSTANSTANPTYVIDESVSGAAILVP